MRSLKLNIEAVAGKLVVGGSTFGYKQRAREIKTSEYNNSIGI